MALCARTGVQLQLGWQAVIALHEGLMGGGDRSVATLPVAMGVADGLTTGRG